MKHIFVIFGPTGCGKSTIGKYVSPNSSYRFLEGDDVSLPSPQLPFITEVRKCKFWLGVLIFVSKNSITRKQTKTKWEL
jgi:replication-associated recombination protein RarA